MREERDFSVEFRIMRNHYEVIEGVETQRDSVVRLIAGQVDSEFHKR
jgi:hypothetical protein